MLDNNCLYNNSGGDYKNCSTTTDIYVTPLIADLKNHDYHLQSKAGRWDGRTWIQDNVSSLCIDAGYRYSDYSNEPEPNGSRINIGPDGNTRYASKSESNVLTPIPSANFSSNKTSGYAPLSVQFNDFSKNATGWNWKFGDGDTSTQQNPVHTYFRVGNYTVNLTVSNGNGTNSKLAAITVQKAIPAITWHKPADMSFGTALDSTQLNASASVPGTFVYIPAAETLLTPGVQILHVEFTPYDTANYTTVSKNTSINVFEIPVLPVANFSTNVTIGTVPLSVTV